MRTRSCSPRSGRAATASALPGSPSFGHIDMASEVPLSGLSERLSLAREAGLGRELRARFGRDFCSNDYLGFAEDVLLRRRVQAACESAPLGAAGSRLVRGELE